MRWWSHISQEKAQNEACPAGYLILDFGEKYISVVHTIQFLVFCIVWVSSCSYYLHNCPGRWVPFWGVIVSRPSFIHQNDLEGFVKHRLLGVTPGISNLVGLGWPEKSHV